MKLTYFRDKRNFGDDLNAVMWQHLLPADFLNEDESELFLGIGSILWDYLPKDALKIVAGSGYGGYTPPPTVHDGSWEILFVRGPRTAEALGLPREKAITDAAILLREIPLPAPQTGIDTAFMPHFESVDRGLWQDACRVAGIHMIDPTDSVESILSQIQGANLLISEAMHGAIVADALRTPWIPIRPIHPQHRMKWHDWAGSLEISYEPHFLLPSSVREIWSFATGGEGQGVWSRLIGGRMANPANLALIHIAARGLSRLSRQDPYLSKDAIVKTQTDRARSALDNFVRRRVNTA